MNTQNPSAPQLLPPRLVIFIPKGIPGLEEYISADKSLKFIYIHSSSLDNDSLEEIRGRGKFYKETIDNEPNPDFDQAKFDFVKSKKIMVLITKAFHDSIPLVIIEEKVLITEDYLELKKAMETTWGPNLKYECLYVSSCTCTGTWEKGAKTIFFISGEKFGLFSELLTSGNGETSLIITNTDKKGVDDEIVPAALNKTKNQLVINTSDLSATDEAFCSRVCDVGKYVVTQHIVLPGAGTETKAQSTEKPTNQQISTTNQAPDVVTIEMIAQSEGVVRDPKQTLDEYYFTVIKKWTKMKKGMFQGEAAFKKEVLLAGKLNNVAELQEGQAVWSLVK